MGPYYLPFWLPKYVSRLREQTANVVNGGDRFHDMRTGTIYIEQQSTDKSVHLCRLVNVVFCLKQIKIKKCKTIVLPLQLQKGYYVNERLTDSFSL